jgi:hypothetical protein
MQHSKVRAIRWLTFSHNFNTGPDNMNLNQLHDEELIPLCLAWEKQPDREVSCEIIRWKSRTSFCIGYGAIGLEVDQSASELVRVYEEDGCTISNELGELRSVDVEETETSCGVEWGMGWHHARQVYDHLENRTSWAEGILRNPRYKAVIVQDDDDFLDEELVEQVATFFGLPVKTMRRSSYFNLDD